MIILMWDGASGAKGQYGTPATSPGALEEELRYSPTAGDMAEAVGTARWG